MATQRTWYHTVFMVVLAACLAGACSSSARLALPESEREEASGDITADGMADRAKMALLPEMPSPAMAGKKDAAADSGGEMTGPATMAVAEAYTLKSPELRARFQSSDEDPLPLRSLHVSIVVAGQSVRYFYDMVFENPSDARLSGRMGIELPDRASPCFVAGYANTLPSSSPDALLDARPSPGVEALLARSAEMLGASLPAEALVPGQEGAKSWGALMIARVAGAVESRNAYEDVVRRSVDPALGEWSSGASFTIRIFPLEPKSLKRIVFAFDRPLRFSAGKVHDVIALPYGEKKLDRIGIQVASPNLRDARLQSNSGLPVMGEKPSEWLLEKAPSGGWPLSFQATSTENEFIAQSGSDDAVPGTLLRVSVTPDFTVDGSLRDSGSAVFLLDTSLSGANRLWQDSGKALKAILENDASIGSFAVIAFDMAAYRLTDGMVSNTPDARTKLFGLVDKVRVEGATNLRSALDAIAADARLSSADSFFLLSDGQLNWGIEDPKELLRGYPGLFAKPWFCYRFGTEAVNTQLFAALTRAEGAVLSAGPSQDFTALAKAHRTRVVRLGRISTPQQDDLVVSGDPTTLYPGQSIEIALRVKRAAPSVEITVPVDGVTHRYTVMTRIDPVSRAIAARAWAEVFASRLLEPGDVDADKQALSLSQRFGLANRVASFIMLERESDYVSHDIREAELDIKAVEEKLKAKTANRPTGEADLSVLNPELRAEALALRDAYIAAKLPVSAWNLPIAKTSAAGIEALFRKPLTTRKKDLPEHIFEQAMKEAANPALASRILSSVCELSPRDERGLRLTGYGLLRLGAYAGAADIFSRLRVLRPFEPQAFLLEAVARAASGNVGSAIIPFEIVLAHPSARFGSYCREVALRLYADLLDAMKKLPGEAGALAAARRDRLQKSEAPRGRLVLFWNVDDTDIDLHVVEPDGFEVYYENPRSRTGGILHWDNTDGLGPELYEHKTMFASGGASNKDPDKGFSVFVHYFGTSSAEGEPPAATLALSFLRPDLSGRASLSFHVTVLRKGTEERQYIIQGKWKL